MKKLLGLLSTAALAGTMVLGAAPAHAAPNVPPAPSAPGSACAVVGSVNASGGVYDFVSTTITCEGTIEPGAHTVTAHGTTTGLTSSTEDCSYGQSASPGTIEIDSNGNIGDVQFDRVGAAVLAWGHIKDGSGGSHPFSAVLAFAPKDPTQLAGCPAALPTSATLAGAATVS